VAQPDIVGLLHFRIGGIELSEGQQFYKTPRTWELWQETPLPRRLTFWRDSSIVGIKRDRQPPAQAQGG